MTPESSFAAAGRSGWFSSLGRIPIGDFVKAVLIATAIAGTLDIIAAHLHIWASSGKFPTRVFKFIASGVLGRARAMQGGVGMVLLGAFFHYFISFSFTFLFFVIYPRLRWLRQNLLASGFVYALFVWFTMNFMVLPLSAIHAPTPDFANKQTYIGICILTAIFGVPIAVSADRFYKHYGK